MNTFLKLAFLFYIGSSLGWVLELFFRRFISGNNPCDMGTMTKISRHTPPCIYIIGIKFAHQRSSGIASAAAVHYLKIPLRQPDLSQNVIQFAWRQG